MREILFRGKREYNGEWVYGSLLLWNDGDAEICFSRSEEHEEQSKVLVYPETVGQFTGLTDKNGKKIFEGDVIKFHKYRGEPDWVGTIRYEHCCYIATGRMPVAYEKRKNEKPFYHPFEVVLSGIDKTTIEVIGNIHDNPELLGGAEDG